MGMNKLRFYGLMAVLLLSASPTFAQTPLSNAITYQGQLEDDGVGVNGNYDFMFKLFDNPTDGNQVGGEVVIDDWPVLEGLFTVQLDFGEGMFTGDALWVEVSVEENGEPGDLIILSPRQPLTAAPYALYALNGPGSSGYWAENGTTIYNTNTGRVGVGTSMAEFNLHVYDLVPGGSIAPPTTLGVQWKQAAYPTPPEDWFYFAVGGAGPISGSGTRMIRKTGTEVHFQTQDGIYESWPHTQVVIDANGQVGIGITEPLAMLDAYNSTTYPAVKGVSAGTGVYGLHDNGSGSGTLPGVWGATESNAANATGTRGYVNSTSPGSGSAGVRGHNNGVGGAGIGVHGSQDGSGWGVYGFTPDGLGVHGKSTNGTGVYGASTNGYAGYFNGPVRVDVLEIVGADVAEKFPVSEETKPGMVVMIDAKNPGHLCLARGAYNRCVAGVVSGAGDIPVGTILGNLPGCEDAPAIALSGRVWVNCDASNSAIEPGDLLTTSDTPGYAMVVDDFSRAHGTVIGKAMTTLALGDTGLVLVLVNLQ